jgi:hypothetical protein
LPLGPPVSGAQWVGLNQLGSNRPERSLTRLPPRAARPNPNPLSFALATPWSPRRRRIKPAVSDQLRRRDRCQSNRRSTAHRLVRVDLLSLAATVLPQHPCDIAVGKPRRSRRCRRAWRRDVAVCLAVVALEPLCPDDCLDWPWLGAVVRPTCAAVPPWPCFSPLRL